MNSSYLDPRKRHGKRTSGTIRRFLSKVGVLSAPATRSMGRHDPRRPRNRIPVWDARLGKIRDVDPEDRNDPLREPARLIAEVQVKVFRDCRSPLDGRTTDPAPRSTAVSDRLSDDSPRSPFGSGRAALDSADE